MRNLAVVGNVRPLCSTYFGTSPVQLRKVNEEQIMRLNKASRLFQKRHCIRAIGKSSLRAWLLASPKVGPPDALRFSMRGLLSVCIYPCRHADKKCPRPDDGETERLKNDASEPSPENQAQWHQVRRGNARPDRFSEPTEPYIQIRLWRRVRIAQQIFHIPSLRNVKRRTASHACYSISANRSMVSRAS